MNAVGATGMVKGTKVRVSLGDIDLIALEISAQVIERLEADLSQEDDAEWDEEDASTGVKIAMTLDNDEDPGSSNATPPAG